MPKRARRILSHHGSDCPAGPHKIRDGRCIILTRVDRPGQRSIAWVSGDCAETMPMKHKADQDPTEDPIADQAPGFWGGYANGEYVSERIYRKRHSFDPCLPTWYGGGFWERVAIGPPGGVEPAGVANVDDRRAMGRRYRS
jgi:hypothetical protein